MLGGLEVLILDALRPRPHVSHYSLEEAVEVAERIGAKRTLFTHMGHELEHDATNAQLPPGMELAYDGLAPAAYVMALASGLTYKELSLDRRATNYQRSCPYSPNSLVPYLTMCCFSRPVKEVSGTSIFARSSDKARQFVVYSMTIEAGEDLAMVLPLPVPKNSGDDAVKFVDLKAYADFFKDMRKGFPSPSSARTGVRPISRLSLPKNPSSRSTT